MNFETGQDRVTRLTGRRRANTLHLGSLRLFARCNVWAARSIAPGLNLVVIGARVARVLAGL